MASRFELRSQFLNDMMLDPPSSTQDFAADPHLDEDYLTLSTIHSAKGLEWESVFVLHAADGNIPSDLATESDAEIEEERRLFYVALTRAKSHLHVLHPHRYYFHNHRKSDQHLYSQRPPLVDGTRVRSFRSMSFRGNCRNPSIPCHQTEHASRAVATNREIVTSPTTTLRTLQFNFNTLFQTLPSVCEPRRVGSI